MRKIQMLMILLLLLTSFFMTGCGYLVKHTEIDKALLTCADAPAVPAKPVTNRQDNQWKNDMRFAHADCHSKLARVREIQEELHKDFLDRLLK